MKSLFKMIQFDGNVQNDEKGSFPNDVKCVIIDLSSLTYVDASGVKVLKTVTEDLNKSNIEVLFATNESKNFVSNNGKPVITFNYPTSRSNF